MSLMGEDLFRLPDGRMVTYEQYIQQLGQLPDMRMPNQMQPTQINPPPAPKMGQPVSGTIPAGKPQGLQINSGIKPQGMPQPDPSMAGFYGSSMKPPVGNTGAGNAGADAPEEKGFFGGLLDRMGGGAGLANRLGAAYFALHQDPNLQKFGMQGLQDIHAESAGNKTVKMMLDSGMITPQQAGVLMQNPELIKATYASLLKDPKNAQSGIGKVLADYSSGAYGAVGSKEAIALRDRALKAAESAGKTEVNIGGSNESELAKSLAKRRGEQFSSYLAAGDKAAALMPELQTLEQLSSMAPNGPIVGRVAELFPEFNDASAAFMSMVQRIAPTMRVEGSGSTSDIEFNAMLRSLGSLRNAPEANKMIYDAFRKKALLDQARAQVVTMYENDEYDLSEARTKLAELNKQNILSDQLRGVIEGSGGSVAPSGTGNKPANMSKELWEAMTPQERALFN